MDSNPAELSQLREKREQFINNIFNKDCKFSKELDEETQNNSNGLDGKTWEQVFKNSFTDRLPEDQDPVILPNSTMWENIIADLDKAYEDLDIKPYAHQEADQLTFGSNEIRITEEWTDHNQETITISEALDKIDKILSDTNKTHTHDWIEYQGAGTRAPETICKVCGAQKI